MGYNAAAAPWADETGQNRTKRNTKRTLFARGPQHQFGSAVPRAAPQAVVRPTVARMMQKFGAVRCLKSLLKYGV